MIVIFQTLKRLPTVGKNPQIRGKSSRIECSDVRYALSHTEKPTLWGVAKPYAGAGCGLHDDGRRLAHHIIPTFATAKGSFLRNGKFTGRLVCAGHVRPPTFAHSPPLQGGSGPYDRLITCNRFGVLNGKEQ